LVFSITSSKCRPCCHPERREGSPQWDALSGNYDELQRSFAALRMTAQAAKA